MKNIFRILQRDLKNILKNPAAIVIMIGLFFIPSLYAWVNIKANWNPYANTQNIAVAVVNNDNGVVFNNKILNTGDKIIEALKKNNAIGWDFVDDWQGNYGLNEGKYYALIEIPSNFSSQLVSLASPVPQKPKIIYRANEKTNAIATKITDVARNTLTDEIKKEMISTINREVFETLNLVGTNIETRKPEIFELVDSINDANNNIKDVNSQLLSMNKDFSRIQNDLNNFKDVLDEADNSVTSLQGILRSYRNFTLDTKVQFTILTSNLKENMTNLQSEFNNITRLLQDLKNINISLENKDNLINTINNTQSTYKKLNSILDSTISLLEAYNNSSITTEQINLLTSLKELNNNILTKLDSLENNINNGTNNSNIQDLINVIITMNTENSNKLNAINNTFYNTIIPILNIASDNLVNSADKANLALDGLHVLNPQLKTLMNLGISNSNTKKNRINDISSKLDDFRDNLSNAEDATVIINHENLDTLTSIMSKNPDSIGEFLSSPINVEEVQVYDINIFGIGLTPFYTVLGIWVGSLLMLALLTTECKDLNIKEETTVMQKHFGKLLLFLLISFIQTVIVALGDVYLLKVYPENLALFFGISLLTSFVFTVMIYTLVSLFGNVGKAIAVVIMVFQIAGSGGIYPIQTNPKIFGVLQPLWPFTYAIDAYRQAIAGPTWSNTLYDIGILSLFAVVFIVLGLLKRHIYKITEFFEEKFKEAQL